jgi:2-desacetyl-2-hydroxyethyl bacteriochlorophyllide A dehydrogenase
MQTLVCAEPGRLVIEDRPVPEPAAGEVLVRVLRIGICGTDYHIYQGDQPFLSYPRVMGHELAVEVVANDTGHGPPPGQLCVVNPYLSCGHCHACRRGKPNCCMNIAVLGVHRDGGMTGFLSLPPQNLIAGEGLTPDQCAMVEFLAIGAHAVRRASLGADDRALVVGAGPIGLGVALFAGLSGAEVTVVDREPDRLEAASRLCKPAGVVLAGDTVDQALGEITQGVGFDAVFDATGSRQAIEHGFRYAAHGGRYVLVSVVKGEVSFTDAEFHRKELTVLGSRNATAEDFQRVIDAIRAGKAASAAWLTHRTTLGQAVDELPRWAHEKSGLIKAVIAAD